MSSKRWSAPRVLQRLDYARGKRLENLRGRIRWRLRRHPDERLRMGFAEHYRLRGVASQAARWGIVTPDWSTSAEILELRHWLLGRFRSDDEVRELMALAADRPLPHEVADLADPAFRSKGRELATGSGGCASFALMILCALMAAVAAVYVIGCWLPRLWQPFADSDEHTQAVAALVVFGAFALGFAGSFLWFKLTTRADIPAPDSFRHEPSRLFPTELAWKLVDNGDERGAVILLKALITTGDEPQQARRALVQLSRDRGRTDQAGRWGVAIQGLTTAEERAAFTGIVRSNGATETALRGLALIRYGERLTPDARHVLMRARIPNLNDRARVHDDRRPMNAG